MKYIKILLFSAIVSLGYQAIDNYAYLQKLNMLKSVVIVGFVDSDNKLIGHGSGVVIKQEGDTYYILTAQHVVKYKDIITIPFKFIISDTTELKNIAYPTLFKVDAIYDLALLTVKFPTPLTVSNICRHDGKEFDVVYSVGFPFNANKSMSSGLIENPLALPIMKDKAMYLIQHSATIAPGDSGGGLFHSTTFGYCLTGINVYGTSDAAFLNWAVSLYDIQNFTRGII